MALVVALLAMAVAPASIHVTAPASAVLYAAGTDDPPGPGRWEPLGPAPLTFGQVENVRNNASQPNDEVTGAIHSVVVNPNNTGEMYIGAVNGGIWKTTKANRSHVVWEHLTDGEASQSIGALEYDPTDMTFRTLVAGIGRYSSFSRIQGGALIGLLRTTDGGATWTTLNGAGTLLEKNISGVAARSNILVASVNTATPNNNDNRGVFRSTDGGATFVRMSRDDLAHGLPSGVAFDLVGDVTRPNRLFAPMTASTVGPNGIYRSDDTGATWTKVSDAAIDAQLAGGTAVTNVELAVGLHNNVYVGIARSPGRLSSVFRSGDGGDTWTAMSIPLTPGTPQQGIHPGAQSFLHMAIAADQRNPNIVYISGDRQPDHFEEGGTTQFPNAIGADNYAGRLFRGDATQPLASQWSHLTNLPTSFMPNGGTGNNSSPHADSREMVLDRDGNLIEVDDGGIYRRTKPQTNQGDWFSLNGNLQLNEQHSTTYDSLSKVAFSGNQDTGTGIQLVRNGLTWETLLQGDGGDAGVDDFSSTTTSMRYSSFQFFQFAIRTFWNTANTFLGFNVLALNPLGGVPRPTGQFYTPIAVNRVDGNRLLIGASNGLYESMDRGDNVARIDLQVANGSGLDSLAYGATNNANAIYMGRLDTVKVRLAPPPAPLVASPSLGSTVVAVAMHPDDANTAFAATNLGVFWTTNGGATWTNTTGNLQTLNPLTLRSLEYVTSAGANAVVVGSLNGVYFATAASGFTAWQPLGTGLSAVPVYELQYSRVDDLLVAGTLGRGAYRLRSASAVLSGGM
ncbi:MAG: RTX toxin [Vicinamibacterales bacterium]